MSREQKRGKSRANLKEKNCQYVKVSQIGFNELIVLIRSIGIARMGSKTVTKRILGEGNGTHDTQAPYETISPG